MKSKIQRILLIISAILILCNFDSYAYPSNSFAPNPETDNSYIPAQFPGGQEGFEKWLLKNVHYPEEEEQLGIEETIFVRFTVTKEGEIKYPHVVEGENDNLIEAALESMTRMPEWIPAKNNGIPVDSDVQLGIEFYIKQKAKATGSKHNRRGY